MKKIIKSLVIIITLFILTGCNYKEINDYAIVSGISIDLDEKNKDNLIVAVQIMNAKKDEQSQSSEIAFYKSSGKTIYEALQKIMLEAPKELYLGHNEVLIISEKLAKEKNVLSYMDYFMRNSQIEKDSFLLISKNNKAYEILEVITPLEYIPSKNIKSTLKNADNFTGILTIVTIDEFTSSLIKNGISPVLSAIYIKGNTKDGKDNSNIEKSNPKTKLVLDSLAFFKNKKLKGYLTKKESIGFNLLSNDSNKAYINVLCDDNNYASLKILNEKTNEKIYFKDKKPKVKINKYINVSISEYNCKASFLNSTKYINKLEKKAQNKVNDLINKTIKKAYIDNKADVFGYGFKFYSKKYNDFKKYNYSYDKLTSDLSFDIKTKITIKTEELAIKSVMEE